MHWPCSPAPSPQRPSSREVGVGRKFSADPLSRELGNRTKKPYRMSEFLGGDSWERGWGGSNDRRYAGNAEVEELGMGGRGGAGALREEATIQRMLAQVRSNNVLAGSMALPWVRP